MPRYVCIQTMLRRDAIHPQNIEDTDIEKCISELDPDIWKAICLLTQPLSPKAIKKAKTSHVHKMSRFFCVCTMFCITNTQCSFPLHNIILLAFQAITYHNYYVTCVPLKIHHQTQQQPYAHQMTVHKIEHRV